MKMMRAAWVFSALLLGGCATSTAVDSNKVSDADAANYNLQLGASYLKQGNLAVAKDKLERARKQNPRDATVHTMLAVLYEQLNEPRKADTEYRDALRLAPESPDVQNSYAVYLCRNQRVDEGVKYFGRAAANRLYRTPWAAYTNAGVCLRAAKRDDDAQRQFALALASNPQYDEAVFQMGTLEFDQQRLIDARTRVDAWLLQNASTPDLLLLGWRVADAQQDGVAKARFATALRRDYPDSVQARSLTP